MKQIKSFFYTISINFTVCIIGYWIFNIFIKTEKSFNLIFQECMGLALIFTLEIMLIQYLIDKVKLVNDNYFAIIQYIILTSIIVYWANSFVGASSRNIPHVIFLVIIFTFIYLLISIFVDLFKKNDDKIINKKLEEYKNKIRNKNI